MTSFSIFLWLIYWLLVLCSPVSFVAFLSVILAYDDRPSVSRKL